VSEQVGNFDVEFHNVLSAVQTAFVSNTLRRLTSELAREEHGTLLVGREDAPPGPFLAGSFLAAQKTHSVTEGHPAWVDVVIAVNTPHLVPFMNSYTILAYVSLRVRSARARLVMGSYHRTSHHLPR
jgi:hypothetical protein